VLFRSYPNKQITTGEGGIIVTDDRRLAEMARRMRNHGRDGSPDWYEHAELGYNYRLPEISCAIGIEQMKRIERILGRREQVARCYDRMLRPNPHIIVPCLVVGDTKPSWFVYVVRLADEFGREDRDYIVGQMLERGIQCQRYFAPIHLQPFYRRSFGFREGDLPVTELVAERTIALPFFNSLTESEIAEVCENLSELIALRRAK